MSRRRKPTIEDVRSIREQMEGHIADLVIQFEEITGMTVTDVEVRHERKPGFFATEKIEIKICTEL